MVVNYLLAYLGFRISLSRARLRLSQFRIRLSLSWLSLSRAPTGLTFSLTMQKYKEKRCAPNFPSKIHLFLGVFFALILQEIPSCHFSLITIRFSLAKRLSLLRGFCYLILHTYSGLELDKWIMDYGRFGDF